MESQLWPGSGIKANVTNYVGFKTAALGVSQGRPVGDTSDLYVINSVFSTDVD